MKRSEQETLGVRDHAVYFGQPVCGLFRSGDPLVEPVAFSDRAECPSSTSTVPWTQ